jgi:hypothetical protein
MVTMASTSVAFAQAVDAEPQPPEAVAFIRVRAGETENDVGTNVSE